MTFAVPKRSRLTLMAIEGVLLAREWETAVSALESEDPGPILRLPVWERSFLEEEIPGVRERLARLARLAPRE